MARLPDLRALANFVATAEEGSIRKAAERLHVAQPPLSRRLQALERTLGATLFVRGTAGVTLTRAGAALLPLARRLVADVEGLAAAVQAAAGQAQALHLGVTRAIPQAQFPRLAAAWKRAAGGRAVAVREGFTTDLVDALHAREIDFALAGLPFDTRGLACEVVASEPLLAALPKSHPAARRRVVALAQLGDLPFFWNRRSFNPAWYDACERVFRESGFRPRYVPVEPDQLLTFERIAHGEGCTLVNAWRRRTRIAGLAYRPIAEGERLAIRVAAAWPEEAPAAAMGKLAAAARRVLAARP